MAMRAGEIRDWPDSGVTDLIGNPDLEITHVKPLSQASDGALTFATSAVPATQIRQMGERLANAALLCEASMAQELEAGVAGTLLVAQNPRLAFMRAVRLVTPDTRPPAGIHPTAQIDPTARVDSSAS